MAINWFPGHMHKARKEIAQIMPKVDLLIEVVDARIPYSSANPLVDEWRRDKPMLKILNKIDLADPSMTQDWIDDFEQDSDIRALTLDARNAQHCRELLNRGRKLVHAPRSPGKPLTAMILGIPNVGKSTLINGMAGRLIAKTGNVPAVTKKQQRIPLAQDFVLLDTPGFLWPKLWPDGCGYRLAITGAIKDAVIDYDDIAYFATDFFRQHYPDALLARYRLDSIPDTTIELMEAIAARRGCIGKGGLIRLSQVSELLIREYRQGKLGRVSLETPQLIRAELRVAEREKAEKDAAKQARLEMRQQNKKKTKRR
ncbi:MAG: ribosome biogenesis GTPase YlqF [Myxococcota bacterium]|nr:ribosome biogenesis GTPase YlqF [Myxococcota bacterium]